MKKMFHHGNMTTSAASSMNACFAVSFCLIMMGAISVVSIILFILVFLLGVSVRILSNTEFSRKHTMAPEYV